MCIEVLFFYMCIEVCIAVLLREEQLGA
jgi:hypothetical protein